MTSFFPTFEDGRERGDMRTTTGELEELDLPERMESKYQFIFLVDRSGSMFSKDRMKITIDAVVLFLQSLPADCQFGIIGFGSKVHCKWDYRMKTYNNVTKMEAIRETINMGPDYGGTDFLTPLELAKNVD